MYNLVEDPGSLSPLPIDLRRGQTAISVLAALSFASTLGLLHVLGFKFIKERHAVQHYNQILILIFSLICADCQQSVPFLLNAIWLSKNAIIVGTATCRSQAWFIQVGDLSSGVFTLAIACHTFADIICNYRLGQKTFLCLIAGLWAFVFTLSITGIAMHPVDFYSRAGAWCWVNIKYSPERLYLHYLWIIIAEFCTILLYSFMVLALSKGLFPAYYTVPGTAARARRAAKAIILYPMVYVICTLPLVTARLSSTAGREVGFTELSVAGAMISCNGWVDVMLYCLTRRALIFVDSRAAGDMRALDTFRWGPEEFGTTTIIEALPHRRTSDRPFYRRFWSVICPSYRNGGNSQESGIGMVVTTHTEVEIRQTRERVDDWRMSRTSTDTAVLTPEQSPTVGSEGHFSDNKSSTTGSPR